ncbi:hypothetical protein [Streptomyces sp. CRN 30]|uniref:hypothetical protein n=1 Tax=Streptomyces sp. CRN 30 TaxID=3075613 RepID=UPI002A822B4B|nr:hypothetical protein [Streptomyces sp. CRN 30]
MTLDDLTVPLHALRLLTVDFGHLPAPDVEISTVFPERLRLAFHDSSGESLAAFEQWRHALRITEDAVDYRTQSDGETRVLSVEGRFAGAVVILTAFADVPKDAPALTGGAL